MNKQKGLTFFCKALLKFYQFLHNLINFYNTLFCFYILIIWYKHSSLILWHSTLAAYRIILEYHRIRKKMNKWVKKTLILWTCIACLNNRNKSNRILFTWQVDYTKTGIWLWADFVHWTSVNITSNNKILLLCMACNLDIAIAIFFEKCVHISKKLSTKWWFICIAAGILMLFC